MRFTPSIFTSLLKPIDRRGFKEIVKRHDGDAYGKSFNSWEHLVTLLFAQFTGADSLRRSQAEHALETLVRKAEAASHGQLTTHFLEADPLEIDLA